MTARARWTLRRFKSAKDGAAAVEFALIAPILMYLLMGIVEVSLMFFASVTIDGAAIEAARRLRTGQAQTTGDAEGDFYSAFCAALSGTVPCGSVYYDVRTVGTFSSVSLTTEIDPDTGEPVTYGFTAGGANAITVVRTMYYWNFFTPLMGQFFETTEGTNKRLLISTVVFQNEPYE